MYRKDRIRSALKFYGENATIHGIGAIYNSLSALKKFVFVLLFICLLVTVTFAVYDSIYVFTQREVYTKIEKLTHSRIEFPSVTICRNGKATKSSLPIDIVNKITRKLDEMKTGNLNISDLLDFIENTSLEVQAVSENSNISVPEHPPMLLRHIKDACLFASNKYCNVTRDFRSTYGTDACYTFHGPGPNTYFQAENGPFFGLQLILYVNESDYLPLIGTQNGAGFTIYIHERDTIPLFEIGGILVAPGTSTHISFFKSETISLKYPFRTNCTDGEGFTNYLPGRYTYLSCLATCVYKNVFEKCSYVNPLIRGSFKPKNKSNVTLEMLKCELKMRNKYLEGVRDFFCDCPKACKEVGYNSRVSYSKWPVDGDLPIYRAFAKSVLGSDKKNVSDDFISKSFLKIKVYFDELHIMHYKTKELVGELDLISNIGGHLGFWCGASVFSVFETIAFFGSLIYWACCGKEDTKTDTARNPEDVEINL
ncbi:amiloride-sensitive sodium channel subunit beta-like [Rhopilema esculentum]|uniref:amiloride-sensitive sodium channel subunit beta-like n=1 Tax=Rhopilema esculentum TaxID=499914 RepID=UPI0031D80AED|eukprot:gene6108-11497_t